MIAGMDFGTTHSGLAIYDGQQLRTVPLNASQGNERVTPTILYITNEQKIWFGREAMNAYFEQNLGRPSKMEKVWVGEITQTFAELPTFVRDVYVWVDVLSPGRLFLSFKTDLSDASYTGTAIGRFFYTLEDIATTYLYIAKRRAERFLGRELTELVLGRPVRFNNDPEADQLAQARLLEAAWRAGYEKVYFEYEPIAAAYYYETTISKPQNVLVFDFGGGTLDITVMRLGEGQRRVLATGGVPIAGDVFDRKIVRAKIPKLFGEGSLYRSMNKKLPIPSWIYDSFGDWRTILNLQTPEQMQTLRTIMPAADKRRELAALIKLVSSNYSLKLFEVVERVKRQLSEQNEALIRLEGEGFAIRVPVSRIEFERLIRPEYNIIAQNLDETLSASGLRASEIDVVIRTGGSSQIPMFQRLLAQKFGEEKVKALDIFGSVTAGLGVIGQRIASGALAAKGYARTTHTTNENNSERTKVPPVNLDLLKQRIARQEGTAQESNTLALLVLSKNYELTLAEHPATWLNADRAIPAAELKLPVNAPPLVLLGVSVDEPLLLLTSNFRLLLVTARDLLHYQNANLTLNQVHSLEQGEQLCLIQRWRPLRDHEQLLIVSTQGYVRKFEMTQLRPSIEGPTPTKIGWTLPGWPRLVVGAAEAQMLLLVNNQGRGVRLPVAQIKRTGVRMLPKQKADELVIGCAAADNAALWLVSTQGYAKWLELKQIAPASETNPTGAALVRRRGEICQGLIAPQSPLWALTSTRLVRLDPQATPHDEADNQGMHQALKLTGAEQLLGLLL
jgi:hypothetical chaperone protein